MNKKFKWLALASTLVLSSYASQLVEANEIEDQEQSVTAPIANADKAEDVLTVVEESKTQAPSGTTTNTSPSTSTSTSSSQEARETAVSSSTDASSLPADSQAIDQETQTTSSDQKTESLAPSSEETKEVLKSNAGPTGPTGKISVTNQNAQTGAFDVVITEAYAPEGIEEVRVPIWSSVKGQDDIKWYTARKQIDNSFKVSVSPSNHGNELGEYHIHLYYLDRKGKLIGAGGTSTNVSRVAKEASGNLSFQTTNALTGDFEVIVSNIYDPNGLKSVLVPVWSDQAGQDDIKWYRANAQADGTYKTLVKVADHKQHLGTYHAHLYYEGQNGQIQAVTGRTTQVQAAQPKGTISVVNNDQTKGQFDVIISDIVHKSPIKEVVVPIWSDTGGQNDIVWYRAAKQVDGTYKATVSASNHKFETGTYHIHLYYKQADDSLVAVSRSQTQVSMGQTSGKISIVNQNKTTGDFDVKVTDLVSSRGVDNVLVPVWSDTKGQNDIKWYSASKQADGSYTVSVKLSNHNYETGIYHAHLYIKEKDGQMRALGGTQTNTSVGSTSAKISVSKPRPDALTFDVIVSDLVSPTGISLVQVPVWSETGGQDDIIWYQANKQADGSYKVSVDIANHKYTSGTYNAHVYLRDSRGQQSVLGGTTVAVASGSVQTGQVRVLPADTKTGTFDISINQVSSKAGVKEVRFAVWSDERGQDDIRWYSATRQNDGSLKARVRLSNHAYANGTYHVHTYYTLGNNQSSGLSATSAQVSMPAPREQIQKELAALHGRFNQLFAGIGGQKSLYLTPADGNEFLLLNNGAQRSASTIKLFVLAAFYAKVDRGEINPNQHYRVSPNEIVKNSLSLAGAPGRAYSLSDLARFMVETSDNTATNIIMRHVGGVEAVNTEIRRLGYTQTRMERYMHDNAAIAAGKDNYIAAQEAGDLLKNIFNRTLLSFNSDTTMLRNLSNNFHVRWLTTDIKGKAEIYNKPGNHPGFGIENDIAVISKNGRAYIAAILTQGAWGQTQAINKLGTAIYQELIN